MFFPIEDLPSRRFQPRIYGVGAWTENLHFAYDTVAALRPRLLVELGTDRGESYFGFCQSVAENRTGTRCFAVDSWHGDEHAGGYDETTFIEVSEHNDTHYKSFSTLLRMKFDEALEHFAPESIELLHLDGLHTEEAVRHDVEAWLPKLAPSAVLLMHDVAVRRPEFGVWKVWDELRSSSRSFTFTEGPGLGVWQKPPVSPLPGPLESLLGAATTATELQNYYRDSARRLQEQIAQQWRDGTIRHTAAARQTIIQIFHSHDGVHREEDSVVARVGHESWKDVSLRLPRGAGGAPLRIDFLSAFTTIDLARLRIEAGSEVLFEANEPVAFDRITVAGDAQRLPHPSHLRLRITGQDPQLYLPPLALRRETQNAPAVTMRLRVSAGLSR